MREWRELVLTGQPLYSPEESYKNVEVELKREEILDIQDMAEYKVVALFFCLLNIFKV